MYRTKPSNMNKSLALVLIKKYTLNEIKRMNKHFELFDKFKWAFRVFIATSSVPELCYVLWYIKEK